MTRGTEVTRIGSGVEVRRLPYGRTTCHPNGNVSHATPSPSRSKPCTSPKPKSRQYSNTACAAACVAKSEQLYASWSQI